MLTSFKVKVKLQNVNRMIPINRENRVKCQAVSTNLLNPVPNKNSEYRYYDTRQCWTRGFSR